MHTKVVVSAVAVIVIVVAAAAFAAMYFSVQSTSTSSSGSTTEINVVAAQNFWGSLASQIGGIHVNVTSIVSDPNTDPHEYQSNPASARAIANAQLVIVNGAGYDTWALNLVSASNNPNQKVLNVQETLKQPVDVNPHFWYSPYFVNHTVAAMYKNLVSLDPADTAYFHQQYVSLNASLWQSYMSREVQIGKQFRGAPVAATEDIFVYMANASGLNVVSPAGFMKAVAEGNDPSPQDVVSFQQLLQGGSSTVHVLVYNAQTVTPLTQDIKKLAGDYQIPLVSVTETIQPPNATFQVWQGAELIALQNALNAQALGK
jgi:zinc/manganese transport system substrate-binding protein